MSGDLVIGLVTALGLGAVVLVIVKDRISRNADRRKNQAEILRGGRELVVELRNIASTPDDSYRSLFNDQRWLTLRPYVHLSLRDELESTPKGSPNSIVVDMDENRNTRGIATEWHLDVDQRATKLLNMIDQIEKRWKLVQK